MFELIRFSSDHPASTEAIIENDFAPSIEDSFFTAREAALALHEAKDTDTVAWLVWEVEDYGDPVDSYDRDDDRLLDKADLIRMDDGSLQYADVVTMLMDDEIREAIHAELAPCSNQEFFETYCKAHFDKYGVDFIVC